MRRERKDYILRVYYLMVIIYLAALVYSLYGERLMTAKFYHMVMLGAGDAATAFGKLRLSAEHHYWDAVKTHRLAD